MGPLHPDASQADEAAFLKLEESIGSFSFSVKNNK